MACGCGKKKLDTQSGIDAQLARSRGATEGEVVKKATDSEEFIYAIYNGPTYPHYIPSPTGIIAEYGILNYGMGRKGDKIKVHIIDFEKSNGRLYLPVPQEEGVIEMANNGNEGIRGPEPVDPNQLTNEARTNLRLNTEAEKISKSEARKATRAAKKAEAEQVAAEDADAQAEQDAKEAENDLVALSKRSKADENNQAVETKQAIPSDKQEQMSTLDNNVDNVPDEQQATRSGDTADAATNTPGNAAGRTTDTNTGNRSGTGTNNNNTTNTSGKTAKSGR